MHNHINNKIIFPWILRKVKYVLPKPKGKLYLQLIQVNKFKP